MYVVTGFDPSVLGEAVGHIGEELLRDTAVGMVDAIGLATELFPSEPTLRMRSVCGRIPWGE